DVNDGVASLHGWGSTARSVASCSGLVPVLMALTGPAVSGPALLLGMADVVVATEEAFAYVVGPQMVADFTGERLSAAALGGAGALSRKSGVAAAVVADETAALEFLGVVLAHLPPCSDEAPPRWPTNDPSDRP